MDTKKLIRKRGGIKHSLTIFKNHVKSLEDNGEIISALTVVELQERVNRLEEIFNEFCDLQSKLEEACEEEQLLEQYDEREQFESGYVIAIAKAKHIISNHKLQRNNDAASLPVPVAEVNSVIGSNAYNNNVRLPTIQLPNFSGFYENWLEFRDTFNSIIHLNINITNIQKLHYLRSSLQGQAAQVIRSLEISEANYEVAWTILCERYDNKKLLINNHIKALHNLPVVRQESATELRKLVDDFSKHLLSLEALGQPVKHWGTLLIYIIANKLDIQTKREWETSRLNEEELPSIEDIKFFLKGRCGLLETLGHQAIKRGYVQNKFDFKPIGSTTTLLATSKDAERESHRTICAYCNKNDHLIYTCEIFLNLNAYNRTLEAKGKRLCLNCLKKNHFSTECRAGGCRKCRKRHHTMLHYDNVNTNNTGTSNSQPEEAIGGQEIVTAHCSNVRGQVMLSTALVKINGIRDIYKNCRAMLDCGSQSSFVTTELCDRLGLQKLEANISVVGINQISSKIKHKIKIQFSSCDNSYNNTVMCYVIDKITENMPFQSFDKNMFTIPQNIKLADNYFHRSGKIELLLGADVFWDLMCSERIKLGQNQPTLQKTTLGWVLGGPLSYKNTNSQGIICNLARNIDVQEQLSMFWELEEITGDRILSSDEKFCEKHFEETTQRDDKGRFIVSVPFKIPIPELGNSLETATKRFLNLERKLNKNSLLKQPYVNFMREYKNLGHMTKIDSSNLGCSKTYYLPHHGVLKENNVTTKLRVVFDGSCKTTNTLSLNDIQHTGPVIQEDLFNILLRFRTYIYVLSADIEKMYRQILVKPADRDLQRILWRENYSDPLEHFVLNTVTYGTASAPYLAVRSLQQAAYDYKDRYPKAAEVILRDFYVDDLLTGTASISDAMVLHKEITSILEAACFKLRKWVSNNSEILAGISLSNREVQDELYIGDRKDKKTLGLIWAPTSDVLKYNVSDLGSGIRITKREILSSISKLFDPLGLVGPCIIFAKIMLQELWTYQLGWDDVISDELRKKWIKFKNNITLLKSVEIPRYVPSSGYIRAELHAFSDASEVAYGTCIYIRVQTHTGCILVNLLCARSRVAPIKRTTIPRLELCGALLAAKLITKVKAALNIKFDKISYWSDSAIVLYWLRSPSNLLKTFVAHRVAKIQDISNIDDWRHVGTHDNPADLISRGVWPNELINSIWWKGPQWLTLSEELWPPSIILTESNELPELKNQFRTLTTCVERENLELNYKFSYNKLQRIMAFCLRFVNNCRKTCDQRARGNITYTELNRATNFLVKLSQANSLQQELEYLKGKDKPNLMRFTQLTPFLDSEGLIRVGGRLQNSNFNFGKKHPLLISGKHPLTKLIFQAEHLRLLHAGPQLLLASVREKFWPTAGRSIVRAVVNKCLECRKVKPVHITQLMGNLPEPRVTPMYPFYTTGVDYAGPFSVKERKGRGKTVLKCYLCLFVCFSTKAVHLEPVTELTADAFLATLRRFVARRGKPAHIYSDNGTNFVGATSQLKDLGNFLIKNNKTLTQAINKDMLNWHFIPAHSPNFGGLWEAGVKASKYHLKRVLGNCLITFEEFLTFITQIEGVLNSRPIHPMSSSPNDLEPLTPGHFLIGRTITAIPDADVRDIPINRLSRFQHLQQMVQHFWTRWSREYVGELQQRSKWLKPQENLELDQLVLLKEENTPPLKWKLGRICETHPGSDGLVRVVSIKTQNGVVKRGVTKVCPLPVAKND